MRRLLISSILAATTLAAAPAAQAAILQYQSALSAANEAPPNASPATGFAFITVDTATDTIRIQVNFTGLTGGNTASHIHCCTAAPGAGTAGVATITPTFTGFPTGATAGTYDHTFSLVDAATYNPAFITANGTIANARSVLLAGLGAGTSYLNIHTAANPGGEIRGFLTPVPEPSTWAMLVLGFGGLGAVMRRRRGLTLATA